MREQFNTIVTRYRRIFEGFSSGQKAVVLVGGGALLLAAFLVFRWVSAPAYAPLYTNLAPSDASAVVDALNKEGVKYKLADNGATIEVPSNDVYSTRITLAGENLPQRNAALGYGLLDKESLSTSDFQQQTDYKRAIEGELNNTLEAIEGVQTAIVHLAQPATQNVFSTTKNPVTASVLLQLQPGTTLTDTQVQAVVHTVASSVDGLDAKSVTVTDSGGNLLTGTSTTTGLSSTQAAAVAAYENTTQAKVQSMLDQIVGPGNAKATVTAQLNFDQSTTESKTFGKGAAPSKSFTKSKETYNSPNGSSLLQSGVVGPDGQQDPLAGLGTVSGNGKSKYSSSSETSDQAVDETVTHSIAAPGTVKDLHIMVAVDSLSLGSIQSSQLTQMIGQGIGINAQRGDSVIVDAFPFNRSAQAAAQQELKDAKAAADRKAQIRLFRNIGIGVLIGLLVIALWISRRRTKARQEATTQAVEQLRADVAARAAQRQTTENAALAALDEVEESETDGLREEINALVDEQPEDVAALLRGWLMERPR